ncbi:MAG TPA: peroxidase family protein [Candidatus Binatia bacterium]
MKIVFFLIAAVSFFSGCAARAPDLLSCADYAFGGFRRIAAEKSLRFLGKVEESTARCRGGENAARLRSLPWVDWQNYWGAGDAGSRADILANSTRGIEGALLDLEYQRIELIKFNLFDNTGTYPDFLREPGGRALKIWPEMRLSPDHPEYRAVGGNAPQQICRGELIRFRTLSGICNDIKNPLMGSTGQPFARNVEFENTFPDLDANNLVRNRHGDRIGLLKPDPQVISRKLFTRLQSNPAKCRNGRGADSDPADSDCDYKKAPVLNVLGAFWIQFMTHDWFSHLDEGHNGSELIALGCRTELVNNSEKSLTPDDTKRLGCRPDDRIDKSLIAAEDPPSTFEFQGRSYLSRAPKLTANRNTAWWDASQLYGFDETSRRRVKRDPTDPAKLLLVTDRPGDPSGYLPLLEPGDPMNPQWTGQESAAFPDNWSIGMSFFHTVFAREHNAFVEAFRKRGAATPDADSGLRNPAAPRDVIRYRDVTADELFEVARLVIAAEIAKIHTIEWTTQLLYDEPLYLAMKSNWDGLFEESSPVSKALGHIVVSSFGRSEDVRRGSDWYSVLASGPGILGLGSHIYAGQPLWNRFNGDTKDLWDISKPEHINGGVNHFGSPFNFPEEFVTVYRLHPLVPDLLEFRDLGSDPNQIQSKVPVVETARGKATAAMRKDGLADWALSLGRQRAGALTLHNHPSFLQDLEIPRIPSATGKIDVAALDLIRDRERGIPRYNEFRRQYGLRQLASFDDFLDTRLAQDSREGAEQRETVELLREVYGQHRCDTSKIISKAQRNSDGTAINDCLGHPDATMVDNVEDVDVVVGMLAEFVRPHGFSISETQLQVFILNASRRLFSDRFFTSSFRPEFYSSLGIQWVTENGPDGPLMEKGTPNGHRMQISPLKRVLLRTIPDLRRELEDVVNVFDPWARNRGEYYSLTWKPRPGAESDPSFTK